MEMEIRTFDPQSREYKKLMRMAEIFTVKSPPRYHYSVRNAYCDFGQSTRWTNIMCRYDGIDYDYQFLYRHEWKELFETETDEQLVELADMILRGKLFPEDINTH